MINERDMENLGAIIGGSAGAAGSDQVQGICS